MALTLISALIALAGGLLLLQFGSAFADFPSFAPTLGIMLGLGAGIDYALLIVGRYREQLASGDKRQPLGRAVRALEAAHDAERGEDAVGDDAERALQAPHRAAGRAHHHLRAAWRRPSDQRQPLTPLSCCTSGWPSCRFGHAAGRNTTQWASAAPDAPRHSPHE
jgi:hypothetical protein